MTKTHLLLSLLLLLLLDQLSLLFQLLLPQIGRGQRLHSGKTKSKRTFEQARIALDVQVIPVLDIVNDGLCLSAEYTHDEGLCSRNRRQRSTGRKTRVAQYSIMVCRT